MISFIVPVYNGEKVLDRCVRSILSQTERDLELLLVDDGSTDGTGGICDRWAGEDPRVQALHIPNIGVSGARNAGLDRMRGESCIFVDADDFVTPTLAQRLLEARSRTGAKMVVSDFRICGPEDGPAPEPARQEPVTVALQEDFSYMADYARVMVWAVLLDRELIGTRRFDRSLAVGEDALFMAHMLKAAGGLAYLPEKHYSYVIYPESANHGRFTEKRRTEITAWDRILELFRGYPEPFLLQLRARQAEAYFAGARAMLLKGNDSSADPKQYLKKTRELKKTYLRSGRDRAHKLGYRLFCLWPRGYALLYRGIKR